MTAFLTPQSEDASRVSHRPEEWRAQMQRLTLSDLDARLQLARRIAQDHGVGADYSVRATNAAQLIADAAARLTRLGAA